MGNCTAKWDTICTERPQIELHPNVTKFDNLRSYHIEKVRPRETNSCGKVPCPNPWGLP